jgi:hypothetical protein
MNDKQQNTSAYVKPALVELGRMGKFVNDNTTSYVADGGQTNIGGKKVLLTKPS